MSDKENDELCPECGGLRVVIQYSSHGLDFQRIKCPTCLGASYISKQEANYQRKLLDADLAEDED